MSEGSTPNQTADRKPRPAPGSIVIGTTEPIPPKGRQVLWIDTTGGNVTLNLVTGE